ncbi:MAG TPA: hypothetical protein VGQ69_06790 [Gemmatimonadales bacterium]|jgi:hypothetical protein|nr:hypothetical protein [Gemmatimonadales bacterium]
MTDGRAVGRSDGRRGIALLIAVVALSALGVISLTGLALARAESRAGLAAVARIQARAAAEAVLAEALLGWPVASTPSTPGAEVLLAQLSVPGPAQAEVRLRALGGPIYALEASGQRVSLAGELLGAARLELLVRLDPPDSGGTIRPRPYPRGWRALP